MNEKNLTASSKDCLRLMRFLSIIPVEDQTALAALLGHIQRGMLTAFDLVPKFEALTTEQKAERKRFGHSIFDALDPERQEIITQMMLSALNAQPEVPEMANIIGGTLVSCAENGETVPAIFGDEESIGNPALAHLVFSHYQTIDAFAEAIGWSVKKASRVVANQTPLRHEEMRQIIDHFKVEPNNVAPLFFGTMFV